MYRFWCVMFKVQLRDFWIGKNGDMFHLGFTPQTIKALGQIHNFMPRILVGQTVREGQALASIETAFELKSLICPIAGVLVEVNHVVGTAPEQIDEHTTIMTFTKVNDALFSL